MGGSPGRTGSSPPGWVQLATSDNGSVERAQREIKAAAWALLGRAVALPTALGIAPRLLNGRPRPCLQFQSAAAVFQEDLPAFHRRFSLDCRRAIRTCLLDSQETILCTMTTTGPRAEQSAWRAAVQTWLVDHAIIAVQPPKNRHPIPDPEWSHLS